MTEIVQGPILTANQKVRNMIEMVTNGTLSRASMLTQLFDDRRDIDQECGYPKEITIEMYNTMYLREGIARRVVNVYPEECWSMDPEVAEDEKPEDTVFEKAWKELRDKQNIYHYLERIDELSGIGRFGIMLLGINDGKKLSEEVEGIDDKGVKTGNQTHELIYIRTFDESLVTIDSYVTDQTNPRFGHPLMYSVTFESHEKQAGASSLPTVKVHWSRIIHVADNRTVSEVLGTPRMEPSFNRLYDIRKILSGSGEMYWKGAFPGYALEVNPEVSDATVDVEATREMMADYFDGLQRYMALNGMLVKSLDVQVVDPKSHIDTQLKAIAITMSIPVRVFFGSEEAKLASTQDSKNWNKKVSKRQDKYLSPMLLRPFIDRMIAFGILPEAEYDITWPDLNTLTDEQKADIIVKRVDALAKYVKGSVDQLIPPEEFFKHIMDMDQETIDAITEAANLFTAELEEPEEPVALPPGAEPVEEEVD